METVDGSSTVRMMRKIRPGGHCNIVKSLDDITLVLKSLLKLLK